MPSEPFDMRLRARRRDRAWRTGPELFLHDRAFDDMLDRLALVRRRFERALLVGCANPAWKKQLGSIVKHVDAIDPGPLFAESSGAICVAEDKLDLAVSAYDLCVAIGTLDTVNDLPQALLRIRLTLKPDSLFIGAAAGGDTLPRLRAAMRAADEQVGVASPHVHPRLEPAALGNLLTASSFVDPVVDVDRVQVAYSTLTDLVRDLRAMGATNVLTARSRHPLTRQAAAAAADAFAPAPGESKVIEKFDILHFAAWASAEHAPAEG